MASVTKVFDAEIERAKIVKLLKENIEAVKNKDIEDSLKFYDEEVYTLTPEMKPMKGLRDLEGLYKTIMESLVDIENDVIDIQFSEKGDMAYMIGSYRMLMKGEYGTHVEIVKGVSVLTKKTGEWKTVAVCYNSDRKKVLIAGHHLRPTNLRIQKHPWGQPTSL